MGIKKFIKSVQNLFDINVSKKEGKKAKIKALLRELKTKKREVKMEITKTTSKNKLKNLLEDYEIVTLQIKKSKKILRNLDND